MTEPVSIVKTVVGTFTAAVIAPATADALRQAERIILGVPQSVLLVAMAGALIGVLLLPEQDAGRVAADSSRRRGHRLLQTSARWAALGVAVVAYAIVAAWVIAVAASVWPTLAGAPQLPLAGLSGVLIRRLLPGYVRMVEKATGAFGGDKP
ncbi:hypothetical protein RZA67_09810 [Stenotrophomonas sp. C3(2023)]|uniref:hypothetical protein n=1 Tax=Stenotrophomonas sp. C3(2023) TaxID=3080277 RepID=UPI00293C9F56|nr:hypothetical protein [Stenotrophomonas sp. C3(2023)]MDV3469024.1 hypothetical protein [Stenotrophomonas sp. C3(2023)]